MQKNVMAMMCSIFFLFNHPAFAVTLPIDPVDSSVLFRINHDLGYTVGYFKDFTTTLDVKSDQTNITALKILVKPESITTHNAIRDESLKSALFLDIGNFKQATFESTTIEADKIIGLLSIKGIAKPITFNIIQDVAGKKIILRGTFNRNDYGITFNTLLPNKKKLIGDVVDLIIELKL